MDANIGEAPDVLCLTADIVTAHLSNNTVATSDVPALIRSIHSALADLGRHIQAEPPRPEPAVTVRASVKNDYIVCLEDGAKLKMLKRYLRTRFNLTPDEYRAKWGLPRDYPMVAPAYAAQRKELAVKIGLGRKAGEDEPGKGNVPSNKLKTPSRTKAVPDEAQA